MRPKAVIIDDTPPVKPDDIQASISDNGEVQIVIPAQKDDDVIGYKIFKANQADHEFIVVDEYFPNAVNPEEVIRWQDALQKRELNDLEHANLYNDKENPANKGRDEKIGEKYVFTESIPLNNLTPNVYYKVKVFDRNYNQSEYSETIELIKKDIIAPPRSVFKKVKSNIGSVDIAFAIAKAKDFDRVELSRKSSDDKRWQIIHTIKEDQNKEDYVSFIDTKIEPGKQYQYRLQTIDDNGLRSPYAFSSLIKSINHIEVAEINKVSARRGKDQVQVSWNYEQSDDVYFIIYRKTGDKGLKQVGRSESNQFVDKRVPPGQHQYAVKAMRKDGNRGRLSAFVMAR